MSVVKRTDTKSVVWQARWTDLNGDRKSRSFKTKVEAIAYEARMKVPARYLLDTFGQATLMVAWLVVQIVKR